MKTVAMVIDLDLCIGCDACTMACKVENATARGIFYSKVLDYEAGRTPDVLRVHVPVMCNHCEDAPCVQSCPTRACHQAEDGSVRIDDKKCIGCQICVVACPYGAISYSEQENHYFEDTPIPYRTKADRIRAGVSQKCDFCADRREQGQLPACVEVCPTQCRIFGYGDGCDTRMNALLDSDRCFSLLAEANTRPRVRYLSRHKERLVGQAG
jgi:Fe-S-cluster-containing dehydrogenase component